MDNLGQQLNFLSRMLISRGNLMCLKQFFILSACLISLSGCELDNAMLLDESQSATYNNTRHHHRVQGYNSSQTRSSSPVPGKQVIAVPNMSGYGASRSVSGNGGYSASITRASVDNVFAPVPVATPAPTAAPIVAPAPLNSANGYSSSEAASTSNSVVAAPTIAPAPASAESAPAPAPVSLEDGPTVTVAPIAESPVVTQAGSTNGYSSSEAKSTSTSEVAKASEVSEANSNDAVTPPVVGGYNVK